MIQALTAEYIRKRLIYFPDTGIFIWRPVPELNRHDKRWNTRYAGRLAGRVACHGYVQITIDERLHYAHRLAWLYVHGQYPDGKLDHEDGNPANNILTNLRPASSSQNGCNARLPVTNTSGVKGVCWHKRRRKWMAQVKVNAKAHFIGYFNDLDDARRAIEARRRELHGDFARHR